MFPTSRTSLRRFQAPAGSAKVLGLVALAIVVCACQKSSQEHLAEARDDLPGASYDQAMAAVEAGLQASPSKPDAWGLELVKLEAYARSGNGEGSKEQLVKLAGLYPDQLSQFHDRGTRPGDNASGLIIYPSAYFLRY